MILHAYNLEAIALPVVLIHNVKNLYFFFRMIALETKSTKDDLAWLMYWVIFGLFNIVEYFADFILGWFPLYPLFKVIFVFSNYT